MRHRTRRRAEAARNRADILLGSLLIAFCALMLLLYIGSAAFCELDPRVTSLGECYPTIYRMIFLD